MLGSRKLLIFLCIVPCVLSFVCIGAFAAPADQFTLFDDIPLETEVLEEVVMSPSALAEESSPAESLLEKSYYQYFVASGSIPASSSPLTVTCFTVCDVNGNYIAALGDGVVYRTTTEGGERLFIFNDYSYSVPSNAYCRFYMTQSSYTYSGSTYNGTLVEESLVPDIADSVFDLGDALITFIMSSWVVMIPLAAWLVILCIGAIRKLVKGV